MPSKAALSPSLAGRNETRTSRHPFFRYSRWPLGMGFSCENLVTRVGTGATTSCRIFESIDRRWHSGASYRNHDAPAAYRLHHRSCRWIAPRIINRTLETFSRYHRDPRARFADLTQCLLGSARTPVVRPNRGGHAFCCRDGNAVVGRNRDRYGCQPCPANLSTCRIDYGINPLAHVAESNSASSAPVYRQRNEARLGVRLAFTHGGRNFRYDSNGIRTRTIAPLRARIERNGTGHRHYVCNRCYWTPG